MADGKKPKNSLKLVWKDAQAEASGLGIAALLIIIILVIWVWTGGGFPPAFGSG